MVGRGGHRQTTDVFKLKNEGREPIEDPISKVLRLVHLSALPIIP